LYKELTNILKEEKRLLSELYSVVSEERDVIVSLNLQNLEKTLRDKEALLMKLSFWEKERDKLLKNYGLEGKTLSEIIKIHSNDGENNDISAIEEIYKSMKSLLSAIAEIHKINEQLIDRSIIHINTAIKFFETFGIEPKQKLSREA
jgi:flagellar biosynthesis/type III secretory pathway chaperone